MSRSGYYKWLSSKEKGLTLKQREDEELKKKILQGYEKSKGTFGYYRIQTWLYRTYGLIVNHKKVYRLMKELGIQSRIRKKKKYFGGKEIGLVSDNILNRDFQAEAPNQKWVTDITYLTSAKHRMYLSIMLDLFNNEVVSFRMSEHNDTQLVLDTLEKAVDRREVKSLILHSDQGHQYTSHQYNQALRNYSITPSMSRRGNCLDNACVESFFSHLKCELMYIHRFKSKEEMIEAVEEYLHSYNTERFQAKLDNLTPLEYRDKVAA